MGKTKKGQKIKYGHFEKFSWICAECGREWTTQSTAKTCSDRGHTDYCMFIYHDDIEYAFGKNPERLV